MKYEYKIIVNTPVMFLIEYKDDIWAWYMDIRPDTIARYKDFAPDIDKIEENIEKIDEVFYFKENKTFENFVEIIKQWYIHSPYKYILIENDSVYTYNNNGLITSNNKGIRYLDADMSYGKFEFYAKSIF
jgi:hypothetical protein